MGVSNDTIVVNSLTAFGEALRRLEAEWMEHRYVEVEIRRRAKQRSSQQNRSLHLFCTQLAERLNDAGYDLTVFPFREGLELPWTTAAVKEYLWRPVQQAMTDKQSTTELSTVDPTAIHEALCRAIGERTGVEVPPGPSRERDAA